IEEACAVSAVIFIAAGLKFGMSHDGLVCAVAGLAALGIFWRLGYVFAALGALGCAAAIPLPFGLSGPQERLLAACILVAIFAVVPLIRKDHGILGAAAWIGIYVALNLEFGFVQYHGLFYWFTYVMIWILPVTGLLFALPNKHRELIDANVLM